MYHPIAKEDANLLPPLDNLDSAFFPAEERTVFNNVSSGRDKMSMGMLPSAISIRGASIWEDASVRADSPEPETLTLTPKYDVVHHRCRHQGLSYRAMIQKGMRIWVHIERTMCMEGSFQVRKAEVWDGRLGMLCWARWGVFTKMGF